MNHSNEDRASFSHHDVFAAHFAFGMAVAAAVVYAKWRGPFGFSSPLLYRFLGLAALLWFGPIVLRRFRWSGSSYPIRLLGILVLMLGLGWLTGYFPAVSRAGWVLAIGGGLALVAVTAETAYASPRTWLLSLLFMGIGAGLGSWTTLKCYASYGYLSPLTVEFLERVVLPHTDTLFLASITNMIRYYGIPSTGLQGTPYLSYHHGALAFFAWLSNLLNLGTIASFVIGMPLLVIPLCYGAMLRCALVLQRLSGDSRALSALGAAWVIAVCTIGFFSASTDVTLAVWHSAMNSQTYAFSLFLLFSMTEITLRLTWGHATARDTPRRFFQSLGLGLLAFVLAAATTLSKGTTGTLYASVFGAVWLRSGMWRSLAVSMMAGGAALGSFTALMFVRGGQPFNLDLAQFFLAYVKTDWVTYLFLSFLWPIGASLVLTYLARRRPEHAQQFNVITEGLLILLVLSLMPGLVFYFPSGAAEYFSNVSVVVGLAALAAFAPLMIERVPSGREWLRPLPAALTVAVLVVWGLTIGASINALLVYRDAVRRSGGEVKLLAKIRDIAPIMALLAKLEHMPLPDRRQVLVDISWAREDYWKAAEKAVDCRTAPFLMPAFSGFAFLDGRPDVQCQAGAYGYVGYAARDTAKEDPSAPLCGKRPDQKFRYIVSLRPGAQDWDVVDCQAGSP